jgi:ribosomal protein L11 methylase PrmA
MTHHLMVLGIGKKLYLAPIVKEKVNTILDIGTGTGICEHHPSPVTI